MNKKLLGTQIESLTTDHGAEIIQFYKDQGFDTKWLDGSCNKADNDNDIFYGASCNGNFDNREKNNNYAKTITLEEAKELIKEEVHVHHYTENNGLGKLMWTWDDNKDAKKKRFVNMYVPSHILPYHCWIGNNKKNVILAGFNYAAYKNAEEIKESPYTKELEALKDKYTNAEESLTELKANIEALEEKINQ